jgi:hypothetical protein
MRFALGLMLLLSACGSAEIPRLPPISVGGGGVRLMDEARTPAEAYDNAYSTLTGCHQRVRSGLGPAGQRNYIDASAALEEIAESLRVMRALVKEEAKPAFDPYIASYTDLAEDVGRRSPPANWQTRLDQGEREVKSKFSYAQAPIVADWPAGMGPTHGTAPPSKPPAPAPDPAAPAPKAPEVSIRLAFKAWKQSHADLAEAFRAGRDAASAYEDVKAAIAAMKQGLPAARHAKLDLMLAVYEQQHGETKGFTAIPAHGSRELILKQLDVVKETLETEYDPDRK